MKKVLLVVVAVCIAAFIGCNTVGGMGKDIRSGGDAIEKASGTKNQ